MLDGFSLDQLRAFIAAAEEGSFSAAGRKLNRAQSAVSELIANLEHRFAVPLFERSGRFPRLTAAGAQLLADARGIVGNIDRLKARARGMAAGLEAELSVAVDVFFPIEAIALAAKEFHRTFPTTPLRLYVEALGGVLGQVNAGRASLGIVGPVPELPGHMTGERLADIRFAMVAAAGHPLARWPRPIPRGELAHHIQLVLTDRSELSDGQDFRVMSPTTWRLADLSAKHTFLLHGLGWGGMPRHAIQPDLDAGRLIELDIEDFQDLTLPMTAAYPTASPPGPAGRWLIEQLRLCRGRMPALETRTPSFS